MLPKDATFTERVMIAVILALAVAVVVIGMIAELRGRLV